MDKRSIQTAVAFTLIMAAVLGLKYYAENKYGPPPAAPAPAAPTPAALSQSGTPAPAAPGATVPTAAPAWQVMAAPASGPTPASQAVSLGSATPSDKTYALQLNLDPRGAGLSSVVLNQFFKSSDDFRKPAKDRQLYVYQEIAKVPPPEDVTPVADVPASDAEAFATRKVEIYGTSIDLYGVNWVSDTPVPSTQPSGAVSATYSITIDNNGLPSLKILKTYTVYPMNSAGKGFEVGVDYTLQNLSATDLKVKLVFNGPTLPQKEGSRGADRQILSGYRHDTGIAVVPHPIEDFKKDKSSLDLNDNDKGPLAWAGSCSVYFNALVLPLKDDPNAAGNRAVGDYIEHVTAQGWSYDNSSLRSDDHPVTLTFTTTTQELHPGQTVRLPSAVYLGPRSREVLDTAHFADAPRHYDETLVLKSGWAICAFFTSDKLIKVMVVLLSVFQWVAGGFAGRGDWGIAIILLVGVVRLCLHPITKRSQVQMMKMGKMGPEMERLKKKYADDKDELNRQMVQFYKAQGAAPILGCLPMFLQMPIWIALYSSLQTTFALRQAPFLWNLTWIHDLSKPDNLITFPYTISLFFIHLDAINLLPILMGVVFYLQQKYMTPPNPAMSEDQLKQQKMMQMITPFIFPIMLYSSPSGLNLYIFASTLFGVIESKVIRKHIKEREEAEKAERVIVDAKPTRAGKKLARTETPEAPTGGLRGFWANLQAKAEEARRRGEGRK